MVGLWLMPALSSLALLAADPTATPVIQGGLVGLLTLVLTAVGVQVRSEMAAKEARLSACEARSEKRLDDERERGLATQERILAALLQSASAIHEQTEMGREQLRLTAQMEALLR